VSAPRTTGQPRLREVLASPKMLAILILAAASGFPNQITESVLQAWLKDSGASNTTIGVMSYVALPYLLKFLWAPFVDRYSLPLLGRRRGWMLAMQLALAAAIAATALQHPGVSLAPITVCALAIVFFSATQDIAIDAYRADVSLPSERGLAAAAANLGYRSASWIAVAVALVIADHFGWRLAFLILAAAMALFAVATVRAPASHNTYQPRSLRESVVAPLRELLGTPSALTLLAVVLLFKVGDAFANKLFTPFMMDVGFSKTEIAVIVKALFTASSLVWLGAGRDSHGAPRAAALDARLRRAAGGEQPALLRAGARRQELAHHGGGGDHRASGSGYGWHRAGRAHHGAVRCALQRLSVRVAVGAGAAAALQSRVPGRLGCRSWRLVCLLRDEFRARISGADNGVPEPAQDRCAGQDAQLACSTHRHSIWRGRVPPHGARASGRAGLHHRRR